MSEPSTIRLGELMSARSGTIDPTKHPNETFDLYSIPAFETREPEIVKGNSVGSSKQIVEPGDVLLSKIVPHIRRSWIVGKKNGRRIIASSEWIVFRSKQMDPRYLRHMLVSDPFHSQFMSTVSGVGGSLLRARPAYVEKIRIPFPDSAEQQRIAAILDKAEELRAKRRAAISRLGPLMGAIFSSLFGNSRQHCQWPKVQLGDVAEIITGYPFRSGEYTNTGDTVKLCRGANVLPGRLDWTDLACWHRSRTTELSQFTLSPGDVILAMDRPWISQGFKIAQVQIEDCPALLVQRVARLRGKDGIQNQFIFHLLNQPPFTRHCRPTETTVPHISPKEIRSFTFHLPPASLRAEFSRSAASLTVLNRAYQTSLTQMDTLFTSLQHRAFRGEL